MPTFPDTSLETIRERHRIAFQIVSDRASRPVIGTRRYVDHGITSFTAEALQPVSLMFESMGFTVSPIQEDQMRDEAGVILSIFRLKAEELVTLTADAMTDRVLQLAELLKPFDVTYEGWDVYYETSFE
jgi:regulator of RNase E activity RraB